MKTGGDDRCPYCLCHFQHDAHETGNWGVMRELLNGAFTLNAAGKNHATKKGEFLHLSEIELGSFKDVNNDRVCTGSRFWDRASRAH